MKVQGLSVVGGPPVSLVRVCKDGCLPFSGLNEKQPDDRGARPLLLRNAAAAMGKYSLRGAYKICSKLMQAGVPVPESWLKLLGQECLGVLLSGRV